MKRKVSGQLKIDESPYLGPRYSGKVTSHKYEVSRDCLASKVTGQGLEKLASIRDSRRVFSTCHGVQISFGALPAFYPIRVGGSHPGVKLPESETDHSPKSSSRVKTGWSSVIYKYVSKFGYSSKLQVFNVQS